MSAKHTPGPWRHDGMGAFIFGDDPKGGAFPVADIPDDGPVARVRGWGRLSGTYGEEKAIEIQKANQRLIAASPDLLEAAQFILAIFDHPTKSVSVFDADKLRNAVAKAKGPSND